MSFFYLHCCFLSLLPLPFFFSKERAHKKVPKKSKVGLYGFAHAHYRQYIKKIIPSCCYMNENRPTEAGSRLYARGIPPWRDDLFPYNPNMKTS